MSYDGIDLGGCSGCEKLEASLDTETRISRALAEAKAKQAVTIEELASKLETAKAQALKDLTEANAIWEKKYEGALLQNGVLRSLLEKFLDDLPCRFDHHGYCQEHLIDKPCTVEAARQLLAKAEFDVIKKRVGTLNDHPELPACVSCQHGGKLCGYHAERKG